MAQVGGELENGVLLSLIDSIENSDPKGGMASLRKVVVTIAGSHDFKARREDVFFRLLCLSVRASVTSG